MTPEEKQEIVDELTLRFGAMFERLKSEMLQQIIERATWTTVKAVCAREDLKRFVTRRGRAAGEALLREFGAERISQVPRDKLDAFSKRCLDG